MILETRTLSIIILPKGEPIFSERGTKISIDDEAGGEFLVISQNDMSVPLKIDPAEWDAIKAAVDKMIKECKL